MQIFPFSAGPYVTGLEPYASPNFASFENQANASQGRALIGPPFPEAGFKRAIIFWKGKHFRIHVCLTRVLLDVLLRFIRMSFNVL